ncbi:hypothetical protein H6504_00350 [Candidatus Woesearchaeota archaeon]|nr:hypothetical protein [Candidatus Woesearchaeota archaeon]
MVIVNFDEIAFLVRYSDKHNGDNEGSALRRGSIVDAVYGEYPWRLPKKMAFLEMSGPEIVMVKNLDNVLGGANEKYFPQFAGPEYKRPSSDELHRIYADAFPSFVGIDPVVLQGVVLPMFTGRYLEK